MKRMAEPIPAAAAAAHQMISGLSLTKNNFHNHCLQVMATAMAAAAAPQKQTPTAWDLWNYC